MCRKTAICSSMNGLSYAELASSTRGEGYRASTAAVKLESSPIGSRAALPLIACNPLRDAGWLKLRHLLQQPFGIRVIQHQPSVLLTQESFAD